MRPEVVKRNITQKYRHRTQTRIVCIYRGETVTAKTVFFPEVRGICMTCIHIQTYGDRNRYCHFTLCKMWSLLQSWCKAATTQLLFCDSPTLTQVRVNKNKTSTNINFAQCGDSGNKKGTFSNSSSKWTVPVLAISNRYRFVLPSQSTHSKICVAQVPQTHSSSTLLAAKANFKNHNTSGFMAWHWLFFSSGPRAKSLCKKHSQYYHRKIPWKKVLKNALWSWGTNLREIILPFSSSKSYPCHFVFPWVLPLKDTHLYAVLRDLLMHPIFFGHVCQPSLFSSTTLLLHRGPYRTYGP